MNFNSNKFPHIVEAMLYIAYNTSIDKLIGNKKLSEIMQLPPRYLEPFLQDMVKKNILHSSKGAKGGYSLAVATNKLTIAQICSLSTNYNDNNDLVNLQSKIIAPTFDKAQQSYINKLSNITLKDLINDIKRNNFNYLLELSCDENEQVINYSI